MRQVTSATFAVKVNSGKVKPFTVFTAKQVNGDKFMVIGGKEVPCRVIEACIQTLVSAYLQSNIIQGTGGAAAQKIKESGGTASNSESQFTS